MDFFLVLLTGVVSSGLFGLWAGRCWQRAIDAEKTLDALALKMDISDTEIDKEFEDVERLLLDYAERLENPTANDLNRIISEGINSRDIIGSAKSLRGDSNPLREAALSEGSSAADPHSDDGE